MLVLGDAHADGPDRRAGVLAAYRETDADVALQTGDLLYYDLPVPTYFVGGNNEDFDVRDALRSGEAAAQCVVPERATQATAGRANRGPEDAARLPALPCAVLANGCGAWVFIGGGPKRVL